MELKLKPSHKQNIIELVKGYCRQNNLIPSGADISVCICQIDNDSSDQTPKEFREFNQLLRSPLLPKWQQFVDSQSGLSKDLIDWIPEQLTRWNIDNMFKLVKQQREKIEGWLENGNIDKISIKYFVDNIDCWLAGLNLSLGMKIDSNIVRW